MPDFISHRQSVAINLAVWLGFTLLVAALGSIGAIRSASLSRHVERATATITGLQPSNHESFDYSYAVNGTIQAGRATAGEVDRKFDVIKPGDTLTVFYDTTHPEVSTAGPPGMPGIQATSGFVGACLAIPLLFMGLLHHWRLLPPWKLFDRGPRTS